MSAVGVHRVLQREREDVKDGKRNTRVLAHVIRFVKDGRGMLGLRRGRDREVRVVRRGLPHRRVRPLVVNVGGGGRADAGLARGRDGRHAELGLGRGRQALVRRGAAGGVPAVTSLYAVSTPELPTENQGAPTA